METLTVHNFAGITSGVFEIRPLSVLIGPQATGKSVVAKLLYFFRGLPSAVLAAVEIEHDWQDFVQKTERRFLRFFPLAAWPPDRFEISYSCRGNQFSINRKAFSSGPELEFNWPAFIQDLFEELGKSYRKLYARSTDEAAPTRGRERFEWRRQSENLLRNAFGDHFGFQQIFVPAGRAFFSQVKATVFTQLREGSDLDPFILEFGSFLENTRSILTRRGFFGGRDWFAPRRSRPDVEEDEPPSACLAQVHELLSHILRGNLVQGDAGDAIRTNDGRLVPISVASS